MNPDLDRLQPYPFEKLNALKAQVQAPTELEHIALSIGEPRHEPPAFVLQTVADNLHRVANYPTTKGMPELRQTIADWTTRRFKLNEGSLDSERNVLPVNGTREALFAFAQAVVDRTKNPLVISPNPFYQIYEGAAFLAGAEPHFLNCTRDNNYIPDFDAVPADVWQRCQLLFLCSPGNPTGSVIDTATLKKLIALADEHDFVIASDECYSELYFDEDNPPVGLLQACAELGRDDYRRCVVFHSLSKRSNLPGLRSGFVAGDGDILSRFLLYRTYHGCSMPVTTQLASIAAWNDEAHVKANRDAYRTKFDAVLAELDGLIDVQRPDASFYLWPKTAISDLDFAQRLFAEQHITVLPGRYIGREAEGINPGENHVRMALVATVDECVEAAQRLRHFLQKG
ncbi:succinyldiaminopimelate transaminase [Pseudomaricurvus alkylphenolicus]|uniref:succinyldiaminopimelate transaminase n=1 Tax=Pseudomaricurvus alkylphenolicus TaxID=1306991 RepID=UPI0014243CD6|nr:succinyldiaminopimelate transaminase [Pseudomaricurvus alkylphenolicus]NIB39857.1 succinyldiaminopimelate transaminase [Pseudomaricurvus alkylphenolicus]